MRLATHGSNDTITVNAIAATHDPPVSFVDLPTYDNFADRTARATGNGFSTVRVAVPAAVADLGRAVSKASADPSVLRTT